MSMREKLEDILRGPGASCDMSAAEARETLDELLDVMAQPTKAVIR